MTVGDMLERIIKTFETFDKMHSVRIGGIVKIENREGKIRKFKRVK